MITFDFKFIVGRTPLNEAGKAVLPLDDASIRRSVEFKLYGVKVQYDVTRFEKIVLFF